MRTVLNHIRGCESCHAICLEFTMLELIAAIECKGPSAFSSSHPPQHLFFTFYFKGLVELVFFFYFFAYIIFGLQNDSATPLLNPVMPYIPYSR